MINGGLTLWNAGFLLGGMFVVSLSYKVPLDQVDKHLAAHNTFLQKHYAAGHFLFSGPKVPRTGGVIIARVSSREQLMEILAEDAFSQSGVADYDITEFRAVDSADALKGYRD